MRHAVGNLEEFEAGEIRIVEVEGRSIGIVNTGTDVYAVLNVCPHELAPLCTGTIRGTVEPSRPGELKWGRERQILRCPWHGYEFDLANGGKAAFTSFRARARMYPVVVEDGVVHVELKTRAERAEPVA